MGFMDINNCKQVITNYPYGYQFYGYGKIWYTYITMENHHV